MKQPPQPDAESLKEITCIGTVDADIIFCRSLIGMVFVIQILSE